MHPTEALSHPFTSASSSQNSTARTPAASTSSSESLTQVASILISQVMTLLESTITTDEHLSFTSVLIPGSTIGKHLRHVHDHFRLLLDSLSTAPSSTTPLLLSYDTRSRNVSSESSHPAALASFQSLLKRFEVETHAGRLVVGERKVVLEAVTPYKVELETSWGRELWFTCLHAIHHFSLLRVIAVGELNLSVPPEFGVAPSTLAFRSTEPASQGEAVPKL